MGMGIVPGQVSWKYCAHLMPFVHADEAGVYLAPTVCAECKSKNVAFQFEAGSFDSGKMSESDNKKETP